MVTMSKKEMLEIMKKYSWYSDLSEKNTLKDIKAEYNAFLKENGSDLFPNERDYDAEDEDGI